MYLDLFDELKLNKKLIKIAGFETAAYWGELQNILKQVVKKRTMDEYGFFTLDRDFVEKATTLTIAKQLKCDEKLVKLGVMKKDAEDPNKIAIAVNGMVAIISGEDITKLSKVGTKQSAKEAKEAKLSGMKATFKKAINEPDEEIRFALERWVDSMVDSESCRFTKAVVELFVNTIRQFTTDKAAQLRIIEIATINTYKDASWAINRFTREQRPTCYVQAAPVSNQKIGTSVSDSTVF